jgi:ADP-ribosyl-[dinitrogen reductase] hydrolase
MRLAPVPLFYAIDPVQALARSGDSSRTIHGVATCVDACRYMGSLIVGAVNEVGKEKLLSERYSPVQGYWKDNPLVAEIDEIATGSFKQKEPPAIKGTGYVVKSLEAPLLAFCNTDSFREGLLPVNLGDAAVS